MTVINEKNIDSLTENDKREVLKFAKYLRLQKTKRGRKYTSTQKYWKDYLGLKNA